MPAARRLDLPAIEESLHAVQRAFDRINAALTARRDPMDNRVVDNMVAGYAFVDSLVARGIDLFTYHHLQNLLELNTIVLCGTSAEARAEFAQHMAAAEERFYEERDGGIQDLMEWYAMHRDESAWKRAAGVYVRILSKPQLFIEGNHRTGTLVMSYILVRSGRPPFVLTVDNAPAFFNPSTLIRDTPKKSVVMLYRLPKIKKRFAAFLEREANPVYLKPERAKAATA
jgi:hypothetical protein